jgi:hypothetical protein
MEVIQEYSENRYYLAALSTSGRVEVKFNVTDVSLKVVEERRKDEVPDRVFNVFQHINNHHACMHSFLHSNHSIVIGVAW